MIGYWYLKSASKERDGAIALLARFYSRCVLAECGLVREGGCWLTSLRTGEQARRIVAAFLDDLRRSILRPLGE